MLLILNLVMCISTDIRHILHCNNLGFVPGSIDVKENLKIDMDSLEDFLKKELNVNTDGR